MTSWGEAEFTAAAGTRMHAAVLGPPDAPDVVCVHGLGVSHRYFEPLARRLAPHVRVAAPDLPGFGLTPPASPPVLNVRGLSGALADWLRATARTPAVLVGSSAGCQIVVDMAVHSPELLGPVVLKGPSMDRHARTAVRQIGRLLADFRHERPSLAPILVRDFVDCGPRRLARTFRYLLDDSIEGKLRHVRTPTVVVRGERERVASRAWCREVAAMLPDGRLTEVPGAGHIANHSAPDAFADIVRSVIDQHPPARERPG